METFTIKDIEVGDKFYMEGHFTGGDAILELCKLVSNGGNKPIVDTQHGKVEVDYEDRIFPKKIILKCNIKYIWRGGALG